MNDRKPSDAVGEEEVLCIRQLDVDAAREIYEEHLVIDFPPSEVKPFSIIQRRMQEGSYEVYGAFCRGELTGYAFMFNASWKGSKAALLDYFGILRGRRGQGKGSLFLKKLFAGCTQIRRILIESERVEAASSPEEKNTRRRRIDFYLRCGACRSGSWTRLHSVRYDILILSDEADRLSAEDAFDFTEHMYHAMYPASWFPSLACIYRQDESV